MDEGDGRSGGTGSTPALATGQVTSWALIEHAASGSEAAREEFCRRYQPVVRAYLVARWRGTASERHLDDAEQEVFLRCFLGGGLLERADPGKGRGFQGYLYGLTRNVAREVEARAARSAARASPAAPESEEIPADEEGLTRAFDRVFALAVVQEAFQLLRARAEAGGEGARRRVELLRLRFEEELPIRAIARRWKAEPARLHGEYRRARREFERALLDAAAEHVPGRSREAVRSYCEELLDLLA